MPRPMNAVTRREWNRPTVVDRWLVHLTQATPSEIDIKYSTRDHIDLNDDLWREIPAAVAWDYHTCHLEIRDREIIEQLDNERNISNLDISIYSYFGRLDRGDLVAQLEWQGHLNDSHAERNRLVIRGTIEQTGRRPSVIANPLTGFNHLPVVGTKIQLEGGVTVLDNGR